MRLEQTVERINLTGISKGTKRNTHIPAQHTEKKDADPDLLDLQELLLQVVQEHNFEMTALEAASLHRPKKLKNKGKKVTEKTLISITKDVVEVSTEEEAIIDDETPFVSYDADNELFAKKQYQQMLEQYAKFLANYLEESKYREHKPELTGYNNGGKKVQETQTTEVQMLNFDEKWDHVRATVMNSFMGGAGSNHVDSNIGSSYDLWRMFQHNQIMSFFYTSQWRN
jgi:hypothetical protein